MGDAPLRLVIVGHNPSQHAWQSGHFYSNPSNWMWRILRETGIAPPDRIRGAHDDRLMPAVAGVGFTDVGSGTPGTDSSQFSSADFQRWRPGFFARLAGQARRASAAVPGCSCGACGAPAVVAFSGKRQFTELFQLPPGSKGSKGRNSGSSGSAAASSAAAAASVAAAAAAEPGGGGGAEAPLPTGGSSSSDCGGKAAEVALQARRPSSVSTGRQWVLPDGWPLPLSTEVWVMTSTSGAAPMTREARLAPWQALADRLAQDAWPRRCVARCSGGIMHRGGSVAVAGDPAVDGGVGVAAGAGGGGGAASGSVAATNGGG
ncbi:uracil-dna glycosylase superfamily [Micractinium conductrix]|uniref:Uracil-dna glycosylase superfamily n=1 Tax=Micractinium conductrix TaxID=554055 RepID=A0A2P6V7A2_9CHLO|nr:uracil-dna glycosylase superfamily [Micractinium conductrix]|eukprot:PSC69966.1 uracil-dna glycosylase superfamily [Micractinium conductrix]